MSLLEGEIYSNWPDYKVIETLDYFNFDKIENNSIQKVSISDSDFYLDFLFKNFNKINKSGKNKILIGFNSAVSARHEKGLKAPFFSFLGVSNILGVPLISISDPSMQLSDKISMGWYAGNKLCNNIPKKIASILDNLANRLNASLVLVGGSAGGFGAIKVAEYLEAEAEIFIWNPQTDIVNYFDKHVREYLEECFDGYCHLDKEVDSDKIKEHYKNFLEKKEIEYVIDLNALRHNKKIYFFQNITDWHFEKHCYPIFKKYSEDYFNPFNYFYQKNNFNFYFDNWGVGHAPFPMESIVHVLKQIFLGKSGVDVVKDLRFNDIANIDMSKYGLYLWEQDVTMTEDFFIVKNKVKPYDKNINYALYLMKGSSVVEKNKYSLENEIRTNTCLDKEAINDYWFYSYMRKFGLFRFTRVLENRNLQKV